MNRYGFKRRNRHIKLGILLVLYSLFVVCLLITRGSNNSKLAEVKTRHRRDAEPTLTEENNITDSESCIPRSVDNFPGNFFTLKETQDGGVFLHILIALYMFGALAIVCDDYFVASLEVICDELKLQEDVAGATFMAAGSSAPEFFTAVIGVFIAKSDVGVGTIVGSAVFNILFIVGVCALFAGMVVNLTWWPMMRDCISYIISVTTLVIVIQDGLVHWYEALITFLLYIVYILIMYFNKPLEDYFHGLYGQLRIRLRRLRNIPDESHSHTETASLTGSQRIGNNAYETSSFAGSRGNSVYETSGTHPKNLADGSKEVMETSFTGSQESVKPEGHKDIYWASVNKKPTRQTTVNSSEQLKGKDYESPWLVPETFLGRLYWVTMIPIKALLFVTIPDCRKPGKWRKTFVGTFVMSVVWIAGFSYIMVWMITVAGDALDIADTVMGLTILAAGTSVPDCLSSLFVARDGFGDMAVSNSIGSNVFDILVCLGLPWLIDTIDGDIIQINSEGLTYSAITLLSTVVFLLIAMVLTKWTLSKPFGIICLVAYVIVITFSVLYELNVFGDFVAATCPR